MGFKKYMIAASVTTREALDVCIAGQAPLFCIEEPLYAETCDELDRMSCLSDYDIKRFHNMKFALLKKVRGQNQFDDEKYEIFYYPLQSGFRDI